MSDVFISYSHKDTDLARNLVKPLEAEGFSVWWDHTIPPGKSWDDVIARGIREAKACLIIWTPNSVVSDWVKEEATIAKEGGKYLPINMGVDQPPLGFRRIQAADLSQWNGDGKHPQWRLLMQEVTSLVTSHVGVIAGSTGSSGTVDTNRPPPPPPEMPRSRGHGGPITGILAGVAVVAIGILGYGWYSSNTRAPGAASAPTATAAAPLPQQPAAQSAPAPAPLEDTAAPAPVAAAAAVPAPLKQPQAAATSIVGLWQGWYHLASDAPDLRTPLTGNFQADGSMIGQSGGRTSYWHWQQTGSRAQWTNGSVTYTASLSANHMRGTISYSGGSGNFEASR